VCSARAVLGTPVKHLPKSRALHAGQRRHERHVLRAKLTSFHFTLLVFLGGALGIWACSSGALRWVLLSVWCTVSGFWVGLGVSFPGLQMFGRSLCRVATDKRAIALTFDDGPDPEITPVVLDCLACHRVRATFFCVGAKVREHPELVRRMVAEGHEVENHSFAHSVWTNLFSVDRLRKDLERAQCEIEAVTGIKPAFFRPPIGLTNLRVFKVARELRLQVTGYTARAFDRRPDSVERILRRLLSAAAPGAILVLHDSAVPATRTTDLISTLTRELARSGYGCVRLDELAGTGQKPSIATGTVAH